MKLKDIKESEKIDLEKFLRDLYGEDPARSNPNNLPYAATGDAVSADERQWRQEYHRDQDRRDQTRRDDSSIWEEEKLDEISNELLQKYKQAAALDAGAADKVAYDPTTDRETANQKIAQANKRFSGIMKATKKQFANDDKKRTEEGSMGGINRSAPAQDVSYEKVLDSQDMADKPVAYHLVDGQTSEVIGKYTPEQRGRARARRDKLDNQHGSYRYRVVPVYADVQVGESAEQLSDSREYYQNQLTQQYIVVDITTGETVAGPYSDKQVARSRRDKMDLRHGSIRYRVEPYRKMTGYPLKEKNPCWKGYKQVGMKDVDGSEVPNCVPVSEAGDGYNARLNKILSAQEKKPVKKDPVTVPYHGWEIKYRPTDTGPVDWVAINPKKGEIEARGQAASDEDAVRAAEDAINQKIGVGRAATKTVNIDFNHAWTNQFSPEGDHWFVSFMNDDTGPVLLMSVVPQPGFKKTDIRRGVDQHVSLTPKESNDLGFQPNGRYILGPAEHWDENTKMYKLTLNSIVQDKTERMRISEPALTVAHTR